MQKCCPSSCRRLRRVVVIGGIALVGPASVSTADAAEEVTALPEMTVTAAPERETGYSVPNATTATKTDTPIMETPYSIQVVPAEVLQDQQVTRIEQALRNVSAVYQTNSFMGQSADEFKIRGFANNFSNVYRDGFRVGTGEFAKRDPANLERIEVLKGPASLLYGRVEPGGLVNLVTKKPLLTPYYAMEQQFGSFDYYRTTIDATGPITTDNSFGYRLNLAYENSGSFREFIEAERYFIAPVLQWNITPHTRLILELDHLHHDGVPDYGLVAVGDRPAPIPLERNLGEAYSFQESTQDIVAATFSHVLNDRWKVQQRFNAIITAIPPSPPATRATASPTCRVSAGASG